MKKSIFKKIIKYVDLFINSLVEVIDIVLMHRLI